MKGRMGSDLKIELLHYTGLAYRAADWDQATELIFGNEER